MSLVLLEGCEDFSALVSTGSASIVGTGRSGNGIRQSGSSFYYPLHAAQESDTVTVGFGVRIPAAPSTGGLFKLQSDAGATDHLAINMNPNGSVTVTNPFSPVITTVGSLLTPIVWHYCEIQAKLSDTVGTITLRWDGAQVGTFAGDTKNGGTKTTFDRMSWQFSYALSYVEYDDIYIMTGTGDSFLGAVSIETLYPNGNGNASQWVGSDADSVNNYLLVNETGAPNTNNYTFSSTVGQQDMYTLTDLVHTSGTIVGVCHSAYMLRTDAVTPINVKLVNRRAADNKSAALALGTSYRTYDYSLTVDPETGAPFTIANVNNLQSGVELA